MAGASCVGQGDHLKELLENLRISGDMTDITLVCEGKEFNGHKIILYAVSAYFKALLKPEWSDNNGRIELPTVTAREMEIILPFLYTGKIQEVTDPDLIKKLLATSHMMQIDGLFQYCYKKLCNDLDCDNCFEIYDLTCLYNHPGMTELVVAFLANHFMDISRSEEFKQLTSDQILTIVQNVAINDDVVEVLLTWAEAEEDREGSLLHIFTSVGLQNVTTRYLMRLVSERTLVLTNLHLLTFFAKATAQMYFKDVVEDKLFCCGSKGDRHICRMFDIKQNRWLESKILPFALEEGTTTMSYKEHVYFVGGKYSNVKTSTRLIKYNPTINTVVSEGKLSIPVCGAGLGVLHGSIYIVNGMNHNRQHVRTVQRYNPAANTCEEVAKTNHAHLLPIVLAFDNCLYVVGYLRENNVERYDHETNAWTIITNIPGSVSECSAAIFKGKLFVNPSYLYSNELRVYDFIWNTWATMKIEGLTKNILGLYATTLDGKPILLIRDNHKVVHFYDDETKRLLRKSAANEEPWDYYATCVIKL